MAAIPKPRKRPKLIKDARTEALKALGVRRGMRRARKGEVSGESDVEIETYAGSRGSGAVVREHRIMPNGKHRIRAIDTDPKGEHSHDWVVIDGWTEPPTGNGRIEKKPGPKGPRK